MVIDVAFYRSMSSILGILLVFSVGLNVWPFLFPSDSKRRPKHARTNVTFSLGPHHEGGGDGPGDDGDGDDGADKVYGGNSYGTSRGVTASFNRFFRHRGNYRNGYAPVHVHDEGNGHDLAVEMPGLAQRHDGDGGFFAGNGAHGHVEDGTWAAGEEDEAELSDDGSRRIGVAERWRPFLPSKLRGASPPSWQAMSVSAIPAQPTSPRMLPKMRRNGVQEVDIEVNPFLAASAGYPVGYETGR